MLYNLIHIMNYYTQFKLIHLGINKLLFTKLLLNFDLFNCGFMDFFQGRLSRGLSRGVAPERLVPERPVSGPSLACEVAVDVLLQQD